MTSYFRNFKALTKERGDLLSPPEYRSIVEMINGIVLSADFKRFDKARRALFDHWLDVNDPHHVGQWSFWEELVGKVYPIYTNMTEKPLPFENFRQDIAKSLKFPELLRRIVLNRFLYDAIKNVDGSVPSSVNTRLPFDWKLTDRYPNSISLSFERSFANEDEFLQHGWSGTTAPFPVIFTADNLATKALKLPIIFSTSSAIPSTGVGDSSFLLDDDLSRLLDDDGYFIITTEAGGEIKLPINIKPSSNDLVIKLGYRGNVLADTSLMSIRNGTDEIKLVLTPSETVQAFVNNEPIGETEFPAIDNVVTLCVTGRGYLSLITNHQTVEKRVDLPFFSEQTSFFNTFELNAPYNSLFSSDFGIESFVLYAGSIDFENDGDELIGNVGTLYDPELPDGVLLTDGDGAKLFDILLESDIYDVNTIQFLIDEDGKLVRDKLGNYVAIRLPEVDPIYVTNRAGVLLLNRRNRQLTTRTSDLTILTDDDGNIMLDELDRQMAIKLLRIKYLVAADGKVFASELGAAMATGFTSNR